MPLPAKKPVTPEAIASATKITRFMGAVFIILGVMVFFDAAGIATVIGFTDPGIQRILAACFGAIGFFDFFVVPVLLNKASGKSDKAL